MIQKNEPLSSKDFSKGLITRSDIIRLDNDHSPNCMDIKWYFDGAIGKRLGSSTTNTVAVGSTSAAGWTIDSGGNLSVSLQSYWKLDEPSDNRSDAIGSVLLYDKNTTGSIVGIRGLAALLLASASNSLIAQTVPSLETGNINFSLSTWVYRNSTNGAVEESLISKRDPDVDAATTLLLHCDGTDASTTFTDSSPSPKVITANGNAQIDTAQFKFGNASGLFDGTADYLTALDSADWDFGTGNFTIDLWVRFSSVAASTVFFDRNNAVDYSFVWEQSTGKLSFYAGNVLIKSEVWAPATGQWYHVALVRSGSNLMMFIDGTQIGGATSNSTDLTYSSALFIGAFTNTTGSMNGWLDEIRISKGIARWNGNFTPPGGPYQANEYEYWLYINTNNQATFRVSISGSNNTATVQASSFGALNTSTWYNIVAWHSNNSHIGISVNAGGTNATSYASGVRVGSAPFVLGGLSDGLAGQATKYLDARQDETGFWKKMLTAQERLDLYGGGSGNTYSGGASGFGWAMFDFGASALRWLTVSAGTGIVASSNLGTTFVTIATSRTQNYQYLDRSKNVLIATSDAYDPPLYWAGSATTFASTLAPGSAPLAKYSINYQGFCILLNFVTASSGTLRKRGFAYADENLQLTDTWQSSFDFPSSADDEVTSGFILNKFLYVSTKYRLFRVAFVGGNPDWSFLKVKDWGFVPRTTKLVTLKGSQVAVGLDWSRRLRVFDGYDDLFVSDNVENDNNYCDFAMKKISFAGSGLVVSHAEVDQSEQEYRLNLAIGLQSSQTTHAMVLNGRTLAIYPYSNQQYQAMSVAESAGIQHLMAVDRSGFIHILNSGNMDVSHPIDEVYDSPIIFKDAPTMVNKSQQLNLFFSVGSYGTLYHQDSVDFSSVFSEARPLRDKKGQQDFLASDTLFQTLRAIDVPATYNTYQFRLISSAGTADPWKLTRFDFLQQPRGQGRGV